MNAKHLTTQKVLDGVMADAALRQHKIEVAMTFPMSHITEHYCQIHDLSIHEATEHERELKRFLAMCAITEDGMVGMMGPVDDLWHNFLTFTRDYEAFCRQVAGRFMSHIPETRPAAGPEVLEGYRKFLDRYREIFHEEPPKHLWPDPKSPTLEASACGNGACGGGCGGCSGCSGCSAF